jgi:NTE family protein
MALGAQFTFSELQFSLMCSDLMTFPISRAVTASSAVPLLFNSIVLQNHASECELPMPAWVDEVLARREVFTRQYQQAVLRLSYRDQAQRPYVHLQDGGLSDNLGVRTLLDNVFLRGGAWEALKVGKVDRTKKIVIILVNAEAEIDLKSAKRDTSIPILDTILAASSVPLSHYTFESVELLREELERWGEVVPANRCAEENNEAGCADFVTYLVEVNFSSLPDKAEGDRLKALPTSFRLAAEEVDALRDAARRVMTASPAYVRLLEDLTH